MLKFQVVDHPGVCMKFEYIMKVPYWMQAVSREDAPALKNALTVGVGDSSYSPIDRGSFRLRV